MHDMTFAELRALYDSEGEIKRQIISLEELINKEACNLRVISAELNTMEEDLQEFLSAYCNEVGTLFEESKRMDNELGFSKRTSRLFSDVKLQKAIFQEDELEETEQEIDHGKIISDEAKKIFRKLVKFCHPDISPDDPEAAAAFSLLSSSYESGDLSTLISIEQAFSENSKNKEESLVEKLERLEQRYDMLLKECDKLKLRKNKLINSPDYKLQQRVRWHKMCGDDLIGRIKENISKEIEKKKILLGRNEKSKNIIPQKQIAEESILQISYE